MHRVSHLWSCKISKFFPKCVVDDKPPTKRERTTCKTDKKAKHNWKLSSTYPITEVKPTAETHRFTIANHPSIHESGTKHTNKNYPYRQLSELRKTTSKTSKSKSQKSSCLVIKPIFEIQLHTPHSTHERSNSIQSIFSYPFNSSPNYHPTSQIP